MNLPKQQGSNQTERGAYEAPRLRVYGSLRELTRSGGTPPSSDGTSFAVDEPPPPS
jgi:hypothetical protein